MQTTPHQRLTKTDFRNLRFSFVCSMHARDWSEPSRGFPWFVVRLLVAASRAGSPHFRLDRRMPHSHNKRIMRIGLISFALALGIPALAGQAASIDTGRLPAPSSRNVDFVKDIQPILSASCYNCHGPKHAEAG